MSTAFFERAQTASEFYRLQREHAAWSQATFGTDAERGSVGALRHLSLEATEAANAPTDLIEYADCLLLLLDATRRGGFSWDQLIHAATEKLKTRKYEKMPDGVPSLHIKPETERANDK